MEKTDFYVYLSSKDSRDKHPENVPDDFIVELPRTLTLEGDWECSLREIKLSNSIEKEEELFVCTDVCEESFACDTYTPILRVVSTTRKTKTMTKMFTDPFYVRVKQDRFQDIRIFIRGGRLKTTIIMTGTLTCTLHYRKRT